MSHRHFKQPGMEASANELEASVNELASWVAERVEEIVEEWAVLVVNEIATRARTSAVEVACKVPGLCHTHPPCTHLVPGCKYCEDRGNCFDASARAPR